MTVGHVRVHLHDREPSIIRLAHAVRGRMPMGAKPPQEAVGRADAWQIDGRCGLAGTRTEPYHPAMARPAVIDMLRARIRPIESPLAGGLSPAVRTCGPWRSASTGWPAVDAVLDGGLVRGAVHVFIGLDGEPWAAPLCVLAHLAARAADCGGAVIWIGARVRPAPWVLMPRPGGADRTDPACAGRRGDDGGGWMGIDDESAEGCRPVDLSLVRSSVMVDAPDAAGRSRAAETALETGGCAVIVMDGEGVDLTASRRLQLAGERCALAGRAPLILLARPERDAMRPLSCATQWVVRRAPAHGAGSAAPAWCLSLVRRRAPQGGGVDDSGAHRWTLEWDDASNSVALAAAVAD